MKRFIWQFIIIASVTFQAKAQTALTIFTNQANALLQAQFGFGVTNIPIYSATNSAVAYNGSVHYALQSVANAYDATTPATNLPSVFRPLFFRTINNLFITGYSCVTTDFYAQTGRGFKTLNDLTIGSNDNVWGIPWVVGAKGQIPAFNEYCYSSAVSVSRELSFTRWPGSPDSQGMYATNRPPRYTNQFYIMAISNTFGAEAWNFYPTTFTNSVTTVMSDQITITVTNNYNYGTQMTFNLATNWTTNLWPGWPGIRRPIGFMTSLLTNMVSLPLGYWSESTAQWVSFQNNLPGFLPSDTNQTSWPVHQWSFTVTNNLMYALIDNASGCVLDFVNLGSFGSSLNLTQVLTNSPDTEAMWIVAPAFDEHGSPASTGMRNQIEYGMQQSSEFSESLLGDGGGFPSEIGIFYAPMASAYLIQNCSWHTSNPMVHYTLEDLVDPEFNQNVATNSGVLNSYPISLDNSVCTLGEVNPDYNSGAVANESVNLTDNILQIAFSGAVDLPYTVWASEDLLNWTQIGTAEQPSPGSFQFEDEQTTNYCSRFYQLRLP